MRYTNSRGKLFAHLDRLAGWQRGETPVPVTVEWDLSNRCTLGCADCHFSHLHSKGPWATSAVPADYESCGDLADIDVVRARLPELAASGVRSIVWSGGGEPLTHPAWLTAIQAAAQAGLAQGLYTSGVLLGRASAAQAAAHLSWAVVSLDAATSEDYASLKRATAQTFTAACRGLSFLVEAHCPVVSASFLLGPENWSRAPEMLKLARWLGATYAVFRPRIAVSANDPATCADDRAWIHDAQGLLASLSREPDVELDPLRFEAYRAWSGRSYQTCYGIRHATVVTPDSRLWLCCQRRGMTDSCVGDLSVDTFATVWSRHPGAWTDFSRCRVMCRLHQVNELLADVNRSRPHDAFL